MSFRPLLTFILSLAATAFAAPPNILWIVADDLGPELGCCGYEGVATPNIDRLAAEGVRYTRAFSSAPVCSASRTAFITGKYQTSIGGFHHRTRIIKPLPEPVKPVTELFRDAGYFVTNGAGSTGDLERPGKSDYNFEYEDKTMFDGTDWRQRAEGQPFFAQVQMHEPHRPFVTSGRSGDGLDIPPFYPDHPVTRADWANYLATIEQLDERVGVVLDRLEAGGLADNTVVIFFGDHGRPHLRGKQWLYEGGILTPLIIRWPDKLTAGEVRDGMVSLIDLAPTSLAAAGIALPDWFDGVDILAPGFQGRDRIFAARDRCGDAPDRIRCVRTERWKYIRNFEPGRSFSQYSGYKKLQYPVLTLMAVMNAQGRLNGRQAEWFADTRPAEELYDLDADPWELNNLATDSAHADTVAQLRGELDTWIQQTHDQGAELEGDAAYMEALMAEKRGYYEKAMKRRKLDPDLSDRAYLEWWKKELRVEEN
ncbi:MAG: sulfatase [Verrucomicrobiae bacterium]|nr:sulfatase [Verrucomicrobiae bacterium]